MPPGVVSGSDPFLQALESSFAQDLNGNGQIQAPPGPILHVATSLPDTFVFRNDALSSPQQIQGFVSGVDRIDLRQIDADSSLAGNQAFAFIGANGLSGDAGDSALQVAFCRATSTGTAAPTSGSMYPT